MNVTPSQPATSPTVDRERILVEPGFGRYFTDHMAIADWSADCGWSAPRVEPRHDEAMPLSLSALHYGQSVSKASRPSGILMARSPSFVPMPMQPDCGNPHDDWLSPSLQPN